MRGHIKYAILYFCILGLAVGLVVNLANGQEGAADIQVEAVGGEVEPLDQALVDQMLAPIALYPDSLLSHILVASTYPLEVIQAARWREENAHLDEEKALAAVEDKEWDPSVKALVPFKDLLSRLSDDLNWLQQLGDAFLVHEQQLLSSVQELRRKARDRGTLEDNDYIQVVEEEDDIVIQPVQKEIVYIPYYDTRTVYGPWWWHSRPPVYWHRPAHYVWDAGFYWSPRIYIRPSYFYGGFHWHRRHLVVNHHYYSHTHRYRDNHRRVRVKEYQRWRHNPVHRRNVRYRHRGVKSIEHPSRLQPVKTLHSREMTQRRTVQRTTLSKPRGQVRRHPTNQAKTVNKLKQQRPVASREVKRIRRQDAQVRSKAVTSPRAAQHQIQKSRQLDMTKRQTQRSVPPNRVRATPQPRQHKSPAPQRRVSNRSVSKPRQIARPQKASRARHNSGMKQKQH